jgi:hypothetical protein
VYEGETTLRVACILSCTSGERAMTATADSDTRTANPSTLRVRRHRERRRQGICLFSVEVPRALIEATVARGLLEPNDSVDAWKVTDALYANELSDKALDWLVHNGVIRSEQQADGAAILRGISNWLEQAEA